MKPIPKELQAYFPKVINADRPWWNREDLPMGFCVGPQWSRPDGYETTDIDDRESIDKANPLPPPPILVGQVWAQPNDDGGMRASQVSAVTYESDGTVTVHWVSGHVATDDTWLYLRGFLLRGDYAPWSGPDVL